MQPAEWSALNRERGLLIDKTITGTLSPVEQATLDKLNALADEHLDSIRRPFPPELEFLLERETPRNLQAEPAYPGLTTVMLSLGSPYWTCHRRTNRCGKKHPHLITDCGEWK
jgi:hypothetical protein